MTRGGRMGVVLALIALGFGVWLVALAASDGGGEAAGKRPLFLAGCGVAAALVLFGVCCGGLPVDDGRSTAPRGRVEPTRAPLPVRARWHRVVLRKRPPDDAAFVAPPGCPSCGDPRVAWTIVIAARDRETSVTSLVGALHPAAGIAAAMLRNPAEFAVALCEPCYRLDSARRRWNVLLGGGWFSLSLPLAGAALLGLLPGSLAVAAVTALGLAALLGRRSRFARLRARPEALASASPGVRARLRPGWAWRRRALRWSLAVRACDPTWLRALVRANPDCEVRQDEPALRAHEEELFAARLRHGPPAA